MMKQMVLAGLAIFALVAGILIIAFTLNIPALPAQNTILLLAIGAGFLAAAAVAFIVALDEAAKVENKQRQMARYQRSAPVEVIQEEAHIEEDGTAHWRKSTLRGDAKELTALVGAMSGAPQWQIEEVTRTALPASRREQRRLSS